MTTKREGLTTRWLAGLMWPGGWVLLGTWAFRQEEIAVTTTAPYASTFGFGALAAAALLSWYFNYGRVFFVAVAAVATAWIFQPSTAGTDAQKLAAAFLLPLNFALFAWLKERGVVTLLGALRVALIGVQVAGVVALAQRNNTALQAFLSWGKSPDASFGLANTQQVAFAVAAAVVLTLTFLRRTKAEQDLLWVLAAAFVGLSQAQTPHALFLYFGAAGLILLFGVLERGYYIAYRDELTGLPSRRALNEMLSRLGSTYAIAMCDVDHFKKFNDTYGHDSGDQVLRMVASKLSHVRGGGRVFRYGGEEFAVVFRGRSMKEAQPLVESLRAAIADGKFVLRRPKDAAGKTAAEPGAESKNTVSITISIGVAEQSKRHSTPELVIDAADIALYAAKKAGRNCVMLDDTPPD